MGPLVIGVSMATFSSYIQLPEGLSGLMEAVLEALAVVRIFTLGVDVP